MYGIAKFAGQILVTVGSSIIVKSAVRHVVDFESLNKFARASVIVTTSFTSMALSSKVSNEADRFIDDIGDLLTGKKKPLDIVEGETVEDKPQP